jgi:hypothetical protein
MQGDNDPVDIVEIGSSQLRMGGVYKIKPLGGWPARRWQRGLPARAPQARRSRS